MLEDNVNAGDQVVDDAKLLDKEGKHPETVSWGQYVGVKESLGKKLDTATAKVGSLEEQLKGAISADEFNRIKTELDTAKTSLQSTSDELKTTKEKSVSEKRDVLVKKGISKEKVDVMSEEQLTGVIGALEDYKPKADLGGGSGGSGELKGSPMQLATRAYEEGGKSK